MTDASKSAVKVRLHAALREEAGKDELEVSASTISELRGALAEACPAIDERLRFCRFAKNDEFVGDGAELNAGDVVDVIPPVSGG